MLRNPLLLCVPIILILPNEILTLFIDLIKEMIAVSFIQTLPTNEQMYYCRRYVLCSVFFENVKSTSEFQFVAQNCVGKWFFASEIGDLQRESIVLS